MTSFTIRPRWLGVLGAAVGVLICLTCWPQRSPAAACPPDGAHLQIALQPPVNGPALEVLLVGTLTEASCDVGGALRPAYATSTQCEPATSDGCLIDVVDLAPGEWVHRVIVTGTGQFQARRGLLLDASAGTHVLEWPLFRSVFSVTSVADADACVGCLRDAMTQAVAAPKPALVQFSPPVTGVITLATGLPQLNAGSVTIDALDAGGLPFTRTVDVNGINRAAIAIHGADNTIIGLRIINVGGDSDSVVIEGIGADHNTLDQLQVIGRSLQPCGTPNDQGCLIDGVCRTPGTDPPVGACGDDGIAVRSSAGAGRPNVVRHVDVSGAFDKGLKVSELGVVTVEHSHFHDNRDGGLQATFSGQLVATENLVENNRGTTSANGLAANGPMEGSIVPARISTTGNIIRNHTLRGISVRSLSVVQLRDDFTCGAKAFGLTIFDGANLSAVAIADGIASVYNSAGGARVQDASRADFGGFLSLGNNAFAFNGPSPDSRQVNLENGTAFSVLAGNNQWQHCGPSWSCNEAAIQADDILSDPGAGAIAISPAQPNHRHTPPVIERIEPSEAKAGDVVRIYGNGFDAIDGAGPGATCDSLTMVNSCMPLRGNCVLVAHQPAEVVAVTPTMLAVRAPFTCVNPVPLAVRTRFSRGSGSAMFCTVTSDAAGNSRTSSDMQPPA